MKKNDDNCFDLLRLLASLIVMFSHSFKWMGVEKPFWLLFTVEGSVGVMMLLSISGFLSMASYDRCVNHNELFVDFYFKRILRIYPALLCSYAVLVFLDYFVCNINVLSLDYFVYMIKGIVFPQNRVFQNGISNGVLWTLPCQLIYYLLIPIIRKLLYKANVALWTLCILLFWMLNCFDTYLTLYIPGTSFIFFFYEFLIGCFLYCKKQVILDKLVNKSFCIFLIFAFSILFYIHDYTNLIPRNGVMHDPLFGLLVPFITIIIAFSFGNIKIRHDISYGIYLLHMLIINTLLVYDVKSFRAFPIIWLGTILIAILQCIFVEEKVIKLKKYTPSSLLRR